MFGEYVSRNRNFVFQLRIIQSESNVQGHFFFGSVAAFDPHEALHHIKSAKKYIKKFPFCAA
jgi:hypothetical protein